MSTEGRKAMNKIQIAAKLYDCRDTAKRFFKDEYEVRIEPYKETIKHCQQKLNLEVLPCVIKICNLESVKDNGMATMLYMAAAVELIEPERP